MNSHKMIEICLKDDNMHIFVMINALICINNYVITCINSMLLPSPRHLHIKNSGELSPTRIKSKEGDGFIICDGIRGIIIIF